MENEINTGLVMYGNGDIYSVYFQNKIIEASLRRRILKTGKKRSHHPICPGDYVKIIPQNHDIWLIDKILPRKNKISRTSNLQVRKTQLLVSNIDNLFVVSAYKDPSISTGFIDRLTVLSEIENINLCLIFNKEDLQNSSLMTDDIIKKYQAIGYKTISTSTITEKNIDNLRSLCFDKKSAFIGFSGVGKSSLINHLDKNISQKIQATSQYSGKGQHTTRQTKLFRFGEKGFLIDTPGVREFGISKLEAENLRYFFKEIKDIGNNCKYSNCQHIKEPHCAVKKAVEQKIIANFRYQSYLKLYENLKERKSLFYKNS